MTPKQYKALKRKFDAEDKKFHEQIQKQVQIIYGAVAIALYQNWDWRHKKILNVYHDNDKVWEMCLNDDRTMLKMLEDETGIELRTPDGDSWHNMDCFEGRKTAPIPGFELEQYKYQRKRQAKWIGPQALASIFLSLKRVYKFGPDRLQKLMTQTIEIEEEYKYNPKKIRNACKEITGINIVEEVHLF